MVVVSYSGREINAKLVYYGTGLSGKTTNLEFIYGAIPSTSRGKMVSMKTQNDRTLFFDLLPIDLGEISGFKTRFMLYTVPGQVFYNATRKLVLRGADAIVFVADSERGRMQENLDSLQNLVDNLAEYNLSLDQVPWVIQYNKRDLPDVYTVEELNRELNPKGVPWFEAVAVKGDGVFETFRGVSRLLLENLNRELKLGARSSSAMSAGEARPMASAPASPSAPPAASAPAPARSLPEPEPVAFEAASASHAPAPAVRETSRPEIQAPAPAVFDPAPAAAAPGVRESQPLAPAPPPQPAVPEPEPAMASAAGAGAAMAAAASADASTYGASPAEASMYSAAASRRAPSLAERFATWLKTGKGNGVAPPVQESVEAVGVSEFAARQQAESAGFAATAVETCAPPAVVTRPEPATVFEPPAVSASLEEAAAVQADELPPPSDDRPLDLPDFREGFGSRDLPESIGGRPGAGSQAPYPKLQAEVVELHHEVGAPVAAAHGEAGPAPVDRTFTIPVSLSGLKPGQKVRINLVIEVQAVDE